MAACEGLGTRLKALEAAQLASCSQTYLITHQTSSLTPETVISLPISLQTTVMIEFEMMALQADGARRAAFKRAGLFFRLSSSVQETQFWHTILTVPQSNRDFSVAYILQNESIDFTVTAANADLTNWRGCLHVASIGG